MSSNLHLFTMMQGLDLLLHLTRQQELVELDPVVAGRLSCPVTLWRESDSYKFPAF